MRHLCHSGLRTKGAGASEGRKARHGKNGKGKGLLSRSLLGHPGTMGQKKNSDQANLLGSSLSTKPNSCHTAIIYGDSSLPGAGPLPKFL